MFSCAFSNFALATCTTALASCAVVHISSFVFVPGPVSAADAFLDKLLAKATEKEQIDEQSKETALDFIGRFVEE